MGVGKRIREIREKKRSDGRKLSIRKLAEQAHISPSFLSDIERGITEPSLDTLRKIAVALGCSPSVLLGEDDFAGKDSHDASPTNDNTAFIPLLSDVTKACCGMGNSYEFPDETIERRIPVDPDALGLISTAGLFSCKVEGDSMTGAKIYDGDIAIIAPEEEPVSGNVVLVCYGPQMKWMIRWLYTKPDGTIVLKAANREYPDIEVTPEDVEMGWYVYVGKVVAYQGAPRNGI